MIHDTHSLTSAFVVRWLDSKIVAEMLIKVNRVFDSDRLAHP